MSAENVQSDDKPNILLSILLSIVCFAYIVVVVIGIGHIADYFARCERERMYAQLKGRP